jgi:hypothetical protein
MRRSLLWCSCCWWLLLLIVVSLSVNGISETPSPTPPPEVRNFSFTMGPVTTIALYDPNPTEEMAFVVTYTSPTVIVQLQVPVSSIVSAAVCRNAITVPVIIGSRGCDSPVFGQAVESSNCAPTDEKAAQNRRVSLKTFAYQAGSSECIAENGDVMSCFGPVYVIKQQQTLPVPRLDLITDAILADSQGVMIVTGMGHKGDVPGVTHLDIYLPQLWIHDTDCSDTRFASFEGYFQANYADLSSTLIVNDTRIYGKLHTATWQRILARRNSDTGEIFLVLAIVNFDGSGAFETEHVSLDPIDPKTWLESLPTTFSFNTECQATIEIPSMFASNNNTLTLRIPPLLKDTNFDKHTQDGHYFHTRPCNFHFGLYTFDFFLVHPGTPDGDAGGGTPDYTTGGVISQNIRIEKDITFADYTLECSDFWPRETTFRALGLGYDPVLKESEGLFQPPYDAGTFQCNAPFPNLQAAYDGDYAASILYRQCYKLGGVVAGRSLQFCRKSISKQHCKGGWLYFDEYCYYKFDPTTDSRYQTSYNDADDACASLFDKARSLKQLDSDLKSWLINFYVFAKRIQTGFGHRVFIGGQRCLAFDYVEASTKDADTYSVRDVSCQDIMFPICRYHHKDYVVPHSEENWDPHSIRIYRDGQDGQPHTGRMLKCNCRDGFTGNECGIKSCGLQDLLSDAPLTKWFQSCYLHGSCDNGEPRKCACNEGYGPDADYQQLREYDKYPCPCPASGTFEPYIATHFQINGTRFPVQRPDQVVCGGADNGGCFIEPSLNQGRCGCTTALVLNPDALVKEKPAFDSAICTAPRPILPPDEIQYNGDMVESLCNNHGIACPSGERFSEQYLDLTSMDMIGRPQCRDPVGGLISGCVCDRGWTGLSCTCPAPENQLKSVLYRRVDVATGLKSVFGLLPKRMYVRRVSISRAGCPVITQVMTQDGDLPPQICTQDPDSWTWDCHMNSGTRIILNSAFDPISCQVQAFNDWFFPCGNYTNPTSGRFYAVEEYRNFDIHIHPQTSDFAAYGCTSTLCMCDPNHTGAKCASANSAYRQDLDKQDVHRVQCGALTVPARGILQDDGKCKCLLRQGTFESRFTGEACELEEVRSEQDKTSWLMCNDRGVALPRQFPYGRCEYDLIQESQDPLQSLFVQVQPAALDRSSIFTVMDNETVIRLNDGIEWKYWKFYSGHTLTVESLQPKTNQTLIENCDLIPFPVNFTYVCESIVTADGNEIKAPQRLKGTATLWTVHFTCDSRIVDVGDPTCYETIITTSTDIDGLLNSLYSCQVSWTHEIDYATVGYDNFEYSCMKSIEWEIDLDHELEVLETGIYLQSQFLCFSLEGNARTNEALSFGTRDCSDPLDRVFSDVAEYLGLVTKKQCGSGDVSIPPFSNVLGEFYGLFYRSVPGLSPLDQEWTLEHARYIGSLLDDLICYNTETGEIEERAFDGQTMNKIILNTYEGTEVEQEIFFNEEDTRPIETRAFGRNNASDYTYIGLVGNPYSHLLREDLPYTFDTGGRPGWMMTIPSGTTVIRTFSLHIPFEGMQGLQVYGPLGSLCTTMYGPFALDEIVHIDGCGDALMEHEERWETLLRFRDTGRLDLLDGFATYEPYYPITVVWWMQDEYDSITSIPQFTYGDISTIGRANGYAGIFAAIKKAVYVDHRWPATSVYADQCLDRKQGRQLRALDYDSPKDWAYLKRLYFAHLAPRFCSHTWQCKNFARDPVHYKCVFDQEFAEPWLGGDLSNQEQDNALVGREGGCLCTQGFAPHPCKTCKHGYGPANLQDLQRYQAFFETDDVPGWCTLPWTEITTKPTQACGGRATLVFENNTYPQVELHVFADNKTRRCESVEFNNTGTLLLLNKDNDFALNVIQYGSLTDLTVFDQRIFYHGEELFIQEMDESRNLITLLDGVTTIKCYPYLYSPTHFVDWPNHRFIPSRDNFWIAKLSYFGPKEVTDDFIIPR